jgi:hypothetical protein
LTISSITRSRRLLADRDRDVARGLQAAKRLLEPRAALLDALVQARVLDRERCPLREDDRRVLVGLVELAVVLVGEVRVPPRLATDQDRDAEEARHRRVAGGEAEAARMAPNLCEAQRSWLLDQHAEDATAA